MNSISATGDDACGLKIQRIFPKIEAAARETKEKFRCRIN